MQEFSQFMKERHIHKRNRYQQHDKQVHFIFNPEKRPSIPPQATRKISNADTTLALGDK